MQILNEEIEVVDALTELGLTLPILEEAMRAGELARDESTPNDPVPAPGFFSYAMTTRRLAELLIPQGWTRRDVENLALIVNPSLTVGIVVSTGDEGTGIAKLPVKSKYPKGPATLTAVGQNRQLELFPERLVQPDVSMWRTWLLLRRRAGDRLFSELSLPLELGADGRVEEWSRRIIFDPLFFEPSTGDTDEEGEQIDIDVPRRT